MRHSIAFAWVPLALAWACGSVSEQPGSTLAGAGGGHEHTGAGGNAAPAGGACCNVTPAGGTTTGGSSTTGVVGTRGGAAGDETRAGAEATAGTRAGEATGGERTQTGGAAGTPDTGDGGVAGADGGMAGADGNPDDERPEFAYVATVLGGLLTLSVDPHSGVPQKLTGSPVNKGSSLYGISTDHAGRFVYAANLDDQRVDAWNVAQDGTLPANLHSALSLDGGPISLSLEPSDKFAYAATFAQSAIQVFAVDAKAGELSAPLKPFELTSPAAYVAAEPLGRFLYVSRQVDGGIWGYEIDPDSGALKEIAGSPFGKQLVRAGAIAFKPDGAFLFSSGMGLNAFKIESDGSLEAVDGSPFSLDVDSDFNATDIAVDPKGQFLYTSESSQTHHISGYRIEASGKLESVPNSPRTATAPYALAVDPSGRFIYVGGDSGALAVFRINPSDGSFKELDESPFPLDGLQPQIAFVRPSP